MSLMQSYGRKQVQISMSPEMVKVLDELLKLEDEKRAERNEWWQPKTQRSAVICGLIRKRHKELTEAKKPEKTEKKATAQRRVPATRKKTT